ncbi:hypothetical protein CcaverHIS002_0507070 [Cutaneotrichosporon cavernicola]|nr:hypothetical protein CcaverHIS002_0507070 [Cutaneotrichosporon cavernicola]BEJ00910.1 hypothetical protein CcaverHIS631_0507670 [Cutaneotrichosporon cavernicola]BEJ08676.1 hypothetical protein CcaverHIS641_0507700 [Cutaneotrichosporon cavernicola]
MSLADMMDDAHPSSPLTDAFFISRPSSPEESPGPSPTRTEVDLPLDVDESFNSSMSFSTCDSPPAPSPSMHLGKMSMAPYSPTPMAGPASRRTLMAVKSLSSAMGGGGTRMGQPLTFGRELSLNTARPGTFGQPSLKARGQMRPPSVPEGRLMSPSRLHATSSQENIREPHLLMSRWGRRESEPAVESPYRREASSTMDIDSPAPAGRVSAFHSPAPTDVGSPDFGRFFAESPAMPAAAKRRAPPSPGSPSSSPSTNRMRTDKAVSTNALFGNRNTGGLGQRRSGAFASRRPPLQPILAGEGQRNLSTTSAHPILCGPGLPTRSNFMRRANSMFCDQNIREGSDNENESEFETSFEASPSIPDIRRRYGRPALPRVDGSPNKARSSAPMLAARPPIRAETRGLPSFGENEVQGKILPCHPIKDDGLVRITPQTLCDVLEGRYNHKMKRYHIIDCRFDYEFEGGHIEGAINIHNPADLDSLLLSANGGINEADGVLPAPSTSGKVESTQQVVLIFHCEFSKKRAPEVARELRTRDRRRNEGHWPQVHYPELYILEGGYCSFFKHSPSKCEPQAYREMEGHHLCDTKLNTFKKDFQRTRSLPACDFRPPRGEMPPPPCGTFIRPMPLLARRRGTETSRSVDLDSSPLPSDASPCPRSLVTGQTGLRFGAVATRTHNRAGFQRHASFAGATVRR